MGVRDLFTRATGFVIVPLWLAAMTWLVAHDVWPGLTAQDPPRLQPTAWLENNGHEVQYAIEDEWGDRLGTVWTSYLIDVLSMRREDWIWLERLPLPIAPLRLFVESTYTAEGILDEFTVSLETHESDIEVHGERFHADFSFAIEGYVGEQYLDSTFKIPLIDGGILSGGFNTYAQLTGLEVGQSWRVQVFNPVAAITGFGQRFIPMLVKVTHTETIAGPDGITECFVVESDRAKAWVDRTGVVRAQEITLPMVGLIRITRELTFDADRKAQVTRSPLFVGARRGR